MKDFEQIAKDIRKDIVKMYHRAGWGHLAPALSCVDILTVLYYGGITTLSDVNGVDVDRMILSKGHACAALYVILARLGYFPVEELNTFYQDGSRLIGLASCLVPGIEIPTGSLGHGICFATGTALAAKIDSKKGRTFVLLGDGESQEGSAWEAILFSANHALDNLIVILDHNGLQASDWLKNISDIEPIEDKWRAFGWNVLRVHDGNNPYDLLRTFTQIPVGSGKPTVVIADTVKGKGLSLAENSPDWHSRAPKGDEWKVVCLELGMTPEELEKI